MAHRVRARLSAAEGRRFAWTLAAAFGALAALLWWRAHVTAATVAGCLSGALLAAGILIPASLGPLERAWMGLALLLSRVTTPLFMGAIYFVVLTPVSLLLRLFRLRPLTVRAVDGSYWRTRSIESGRSDLSRQF